MSKGKDKSRSKTRSPDRRYRSKEWTDSTIQSILDAAPSDEARKVLLSNPNMMKALLRRASRHTDADGAADTSIFKRIFADEVFNSPPEVTNLRQREDRLQMEMQRAQEAELRLLNAQAKVNQLILEKQRANLAAEQAKEEATRIQVRLESIREDIERRNDAMKRLEDDYDKLDQEAARVRSENYKLKLKEAHAAGRAEGRNEGRTIGRREGAQLGYEEGYGAGFALGSREMADKLMKALDDEDEPLPPELNGGKQEQAHTRNPSGSSQDGYQDFRNIGKKPSERSRDRDQERERRRAERASRQQQQPVEPPPTSIPVPAVHVQAPSVSTEQSPIQMPEPQVHMHMHPETEEEEEEEELHSPAPMTVTRSPSPTPAQQVIRDYHESPDPYVPPIPIQNVPSPRPHPVRNPLPDTFIPVVSGNDPDGRMFDMPAAHEFAATPSATAQPLPPPKSPRPPPQMFTREEVPRQNATPDIPAFIPQQHSGVGQQQHQVPFIPPTRDLPPPVQKTPIRPRDYRRSDSPDRASTPLSEMSLLQRQAAEAEDDSGIAMPYTYPMLKRNHSVLSVIQEQSDTDGTSPIAQRMHSQSPGLTRPPYEAAPMGMPTPTLSYIPASVDGFDEGSHYAPPMPTGQSKGIQYDYADPHQYHDQYHDQYQDQYQYQPAEASPMMPAYAVAPHPDAFVPVLPHEAHSSGPFVPPQNPTPEPIAPPAPQITITRTGSGMKKSKKDRKRSQEPVVVQPVPDIQINPPSDKSESAHRISQVDLQPQEQPPQLNTPQRMPVPVTTVNSDSEDSTAGGRAPRIAPQPPPPPAFVPRDAATPQPAVVPFIPPPPITPKPPTPEPAHPVIPVATGTSRRSSKKGKKSRQSAPVVPPSPVNDPSSITMPVPEVMSMMHTGTGEIVTELPPHATIGSIPAGTVMDMMDDGMGMYDQAPPPPFVPPSPGAIAMPTPRIPHITGQLVPSEPSSPVPPPSRTPEIEPVVPAETSSLPISAVPNPTPKGFVPKEPPPVAFGYQTPGASRQKIPLGRPNPSAAYSLTARTPRVVTGMATKDGLPAMTPEPSQAAHLPVVPNSVASSSPMVPPGAFDNGPPVIPQFTGSQFTVSQQNTGSQQYGIPYQPTGSQFGVPRQQTGSQQYGLPRQYEVPQSYVSTRQNTGSQQGSQQYSSSQQHSGSQSYAGWGRIKRPESSEPKSPYVPPMDQIPAATPYVPPVNLVAATMNRVSPSRHATGSEIRSPVVPVSEPYAVPVQQPGPGAKRGFVPPSAALNAANGQPKIPRPRGERTGMPLTGRVYRNGPLTMATPEPQAVQPAPVPSPEPQPIQPERSPEVPNQTRPRPRTESQHKGILKKQGAVFPEPEAVAASPYPQVKTHRSGGYNYEPAAPAAPAHMYPGYRTPGPSAQSLPAGLMTPNMGSRPGTAEPWAHAPQDFQPPNFQVGAAAMATPRTAVSAFDKDFKTPRTIFEPISSDQSSIYDPNSPVEQYHSLSGATPGPQYSGLPDDDDSDAAEPFVPDASGITASPYVPGVQLPTGGSSSGFIPPNAHRTGGSSSGFVPPAVQRMTTGGSASGFVPPAAQRMTTGGSTSSFVPPGAQRMTTGGSTSGFVPPGVQRMTTGGSSAGFVPPGVPTVRSPPEPAVPSAYTSYLSARKPASILTKTPKVSMHEIPDEEDPTGAPPLEPTRAPSPPRPARRGKGKTKRR